MHNKIILLMIGGGIAAYKSLELIRLLKKRGAIVRVILTKGGAQFVTPLSVSTLSGEKTFTDLFDLDDEAKIGHIRLAREADLIVVAPATADLMAKMAHGLANDLATTCLLAADSPILIAPAMNPVMWEAAPTKRNRTMLDKDGVQFAGPDQGEMACGEQGEGRMLEPDKILTHIEALLVQKKHECSSGALNGRHVLITAGPTHEPIDPVRYIANRSSGKQGYALARAAREQGAMVTLVSGPTELAVPENIEFVQVETARQMLVAVKEALPVDIAICAAAVADWRVDQDIDQKIKKKGSKPPVLGLVENPDILREISKTGSKRPDLVIGFAAETQNILENARKKRKTKGCDWIIANDVSMQSGTFGGDKNQVTLIRADEVDEWPLLDKDEVATRLMRIVAQTLSNKELAAE